MPNHPSAVVDNDQAPSPRFLTVDSRVPAALRQLIEEADGCLNMGFATGGTLCARRAVKTVLTLEGVGSGDDFPARLMSLSAKHPAVPPSLFKILELLGRGEDALQADALKALIVAVKALVYEMYVVGAERVERQKYVSELVESLARGNGEKAPAKPKEKK